MREIKKRKNSRISFSTFWILIPIDIMTCIGNAQKYTSRTFIE